MFKFLFKSRKQPEVVVETQRETFERLVSELNGAIDLLSDKPKVTLDPATGRVSFDLPEQFPDEALALPAPAAKGDETPAPVADAAADDPGEAPTAPPKAADTPDAPADTTAAPQADATPDVEKTGTEKADTKKPDAEKAVA